MPNKASIPKLVVFTGLQGSGKSTIAQAVSDMLNIQVFSVDPIESAIIKSGIRKGFQTGLAAYLVADELAREQLRQRRNVIIDAANYVPEAHKQWESLSDTLKARLIIIECICSDKQLHKERIDGRTRNLHGFEEVKWDDVEKRIEESTSWDKEKLVLDSAEDFELSLSKAIEFISRK